MKRLRSHRATVRCDQLVFRSTLFQKESENDMRIEQMLPHMTSWQDDRVRRASSWECHDYQHGNVAYRDVYHYGTLMIRFTCDRFPYTLDHAECWTCTPVSVGHGSVSDQGGVNQLVRFYGFRYHRDQAGGGARVVYTFTGEVVVD